MMIESGSEKTKVAPAPTGPVYGRLERMVVEREVLRDGNVRTTERAGMTAVVMKPGRGVKSSDGVSTEPPSVSDPSRRFYVSVVDGGRQALLLGPYEKHETALSQVDRARELAEAADPWAHFYAFGTCSLPRESNPATKFGV